MNIQNISKKEKEVVVTLSADELVKICNIFHGATAEKEKEPNDLYHTLYSELMIARELCQYGHIDNFAMSQIIECRNRCNGGSKNMKQQ